jgi:hypothetical protein
MLDSLGMAARTCRVTVTDPEKVSHTVEVTATSLKPSPRHRRRGHLKLKSGGSEVAEFAVENRD